MSTETSLLKEPPEIHSLLLAEYGTLREEILKRIELRSQVVSLTLVILGTILGFGLQARSSSVILLYPILALFLAVNWTHNGTRIREISTYIREQIENRVEENTLAWEHRFAPKRRGRLNFLSASGIFISSSFLAIIVALPLTSFNTIDLLLFSVAIISVICSLILLSHYLIKAY